MNYLGHEVIAGSIRPGQPNICAVSDFNRPQKVHGVRQFVEIAPYFRKFVKGIRRNRPLTYLRINCLWGREQEHAFITTKYDVRARTGHL